MKKNLIFCRKKGNMGFFIIFTVLAIFSGCGKDDKNVTSGTMPYYYRLGTDTTLAKYLNAIPRLTIQSPVTKAATPTVVDLQPPATTMASDLQLNLTSYRIYVVTPTAIGSVFNVPTSLATTYFTDSIDTAVGTYVYTLTNVFTVKDTTYNFYTEVESLPTKSVIVQKYQ